MGEMRKTKVANGKNTYRLPHSLRLAQTAVLAAVIAMAYAICTNTPGKKEACGKDTQHGQNDIEVSTTCLYLNGDGNVSGSL